MIKGAWKLLYCPSTVEIWCINIQMPQSFPYGQLSVVASPIGWTCNNCLHYTRISGWVCNNNYCLKYFRTPSKLPRRYKRWVRYMVRLLFEIVEKSESLHAAIVLLILARFHSKVTDTSQMETVIICCKWCLDEVGSCLWATPWFFIVVRDLQFTMSS